jgi:hypothetical protein
VTERNSSNIMAFTSVASLVICCHVVGTRRDKTWNFYKQPSQAAIDAQSVHQTYCYLRESEITRAWSKELGSFSQATGSSPRMPPSARPFFAKILPACAMASKCIRSSPRLQQRIRFQRKGVETTGLAAESTARLEQLLELETRQRGQYCWLPLWAISYVHTVQSC